MSVTCPNCTHRKWEPRQSGSRNDVLGNQELALRFFPTQTLWLSIFSCCFHLSSRVCPPCGAALSLEDSHVSFALPLSPPRLFLPCVLSVSPACVSHRAPSRVFSVSVSALFMLSLTISLLSLSLLLLLFLLFFSLLLSLSCALLPTMTTQTLLWWTSVFAVTRGGSGPAELRRAGRCASCTLCWAHLWTQARGLQLGDSGSRGWTLPAHSQPVPLSYCGRLAGQWMALNRQACRD